jgi:AcrR family transcriptional regulator
MARVVKEAEVRREELLELALGLFMATGYERTSVESITREAGVAKGTFYHYFESKQDLLEQLAQSWADALFVHLETSLAEFEGDAIARLRALSQLASAWKLERKDASVAFGRMLYAQGNLALRHELFSAWFERTLPLVTTILVEGVDEGAFNVADARASAGIIISIWYDWGDRVAQRLYLPGADQAAIALVARELEAGYRAQERILGVAEGALDPGIDVEHALRGLIGSESSGRV